MTYIGLCSEISVASTIKLEGEPQIRLYADNIYLKCDEREQFAKTTQEYLVSLLQYQTFTINPQNQRI